MRSKIQIIGLIFLTIAASGCIQTEQTLSADPNKTVGASEDIDNKVLRTYDIEEVVDGDTIKIKNGSQIETVRLLGIDTPEVHKSVDPTDWEGIPDNEESRACLRRWGEISSSSLKNFSDQKIALEFDPESDRRGYYDRLLAYVYYTNSDGSKENLSLNQVLVKAGAARVYESDFSKLETYREHEESAQEKNLGAWACRGINSTDSSENKSDTSSSSTETNNTNNTESQGTFDGSISLDISDSTPCQYSSVSIDGQALNNRGEPLVDAEVISSWHYKTTSSTELATTDSQGGFSLSREIGRASTSYEVDVDVNVEKNNFSASNSISFTPRSC